MHQVSKPKYRKQSRTAAIASGSKQQVLLWTHLAVRQTNAAPKFEIAIDTIGPWEIPMQNGNNV